MAASVQEAAKMARTELARAKLARAKLALIAGGGEAGMRGDGDGMIPTRSNVEDLFTLKDEPGRVQVAGLTVPKLTVFARSNGVHIAVGG